MQAVIALCHFCEEHGPRVVVTCQPMRSIPLHADDPVCTDRITDCPPSTSNSNEQPLFYGDCTKVTYDTDRRCNACTSLGNQKCLLSNDHEHRTSYISSQVALKEQVCERVKNACMRSLSYEIAVPTDDGAPNYNTQPIRIHDNNAHSEDYDINLTSIESVRRSDGHFMFGDNETGFCLSFIFRLHDAKARGFIKRFAFLIITQEKTLLTTYHGLFLESIRRIKNMLQDQAKIVYEREMNKIQEDSLVRPEHASVVSRLPQGFLKQCKIRVDPSRGLPLITGNKNLWFDLHWCMMWTLRTQTVRFDDQLMEGLPTQDMLVMMEMEHSDIVELDLDLPNQAEVTQLQLKNLKWISNEIANQNEQDLDLLLYHLITGGQIVVIGQEQSVAKQFIMALSNLLPIGCLRILANIDQYFLNTECNMIYSAKPLQFDNTDGNVLLIHIRSAADAGDGSLVGCQIEFDRQIRPSTRPGVLPNLLKRYKQLLLDPEIQKHVLEATIRSTREQWMSHSKLLYQLEEQRERDPCMASGDLIHLVRGCTEADRPVLYFWRGGLSKAYKQYVIDTIDELRNIRRSQ